MRKETISIQALHCAFSSALNLVGRTEHVQALLSWLSQCNWRITCQCHLEGLDSGKQDSIRCLWCPSSHSLSLTSDPRCLLQAGAYRSGLTSYLLCFINYAPWVFLFWEFSDAPKARNCPGEYFSPLILSWKILNDIYKLLREHLKAPSPSGPQQWPQQDAPYMAFLPFFLLSFLSPHLWDHLSSDLPVHTSLPQVLLLKKTQLI